MDNSGLITDEILVNNNYTGDLNIELNDNPEKGIEAGASNLGDYDVSGDVTLNGNEMSKNSYTITFELM